VAVEAAVTEEVSVAAEVEEHLAVVEHPEVDVEEAQEELKARQSSLNLIVTTESSSLVERKTRSSH
jgi:hypothetical protein